MKIIINQKEYQVELYDNSSSKAFKEMLPLNITMNELNGNEKYCYLNTSINTEATNVKNINKGDLMLFGSNCLVLFYQNFITGYRYSPIGRLKDCNDLDSIVGNGNIKVKFK